MGVYSTVFSKTDLQLFVVTVSGERLTSRLRVQLFKAMLQQSVGWHDDEDHTTGSLTTILSTDADKVKYVRARE